MLKCVDEERKILEMVEGDFGQNLAFHIRANAETITPQDSFSIKIYKSVNGELLVSKTYTDIQDLTFDFSLTLEDSKKMSIGMYYYDLDWFQGQNFLGNLIAKAKFHVKEKAGVPNEE